MNDDEIKTTLPTSCPHCSGSELYVRRLSSHGEHGPYFLDGLGEFLHYAQFDVVVCAWCGLTQFFAEPSAQRNVKSNPNWRPINARTWPSVLPPALPNQLEQLDQLDQQDQDDVSQPSQCLDCRAAIPAGTDTCPKCGWTYKPGG